MADLIQNFRNEVAKLLNCDNAAKERLLATFDKNMAAPFMEANEEATRKFCTQHSAPRRP